MTFAETAETNTVPFDEPVAEDTEGLGTILVGSPYVRRPLPSAGNMSVVATLMTIPVLVSGADAGADAGADTASRDAAVQESSLTQRGLVVVPQALAQALDVPGRNAAPAARRVAAQLLSDLARSILETPQRVVVTRSGHIACTYIEGRKLATFECDDEGDVVLTLSDRATEDEAEASVLALGDLETAIGRTHHFLRA